MTELTSVEAVDQLFEAGDALVFKHSSRCPISAAAHGAVQRFVEQNGSVPVYLVDVIAHRDVSQYVSRLAGISHQSPQAILLRDGRPGWHASHFDITAESLERETAAKP